MNTARRQDYYWNSGYDTLPPNAVAKNVLTVTSVNDVSGGWSSPASAESSPFASWGPPDYGHIKPDVAANGEKLYSSVEDGGYSDQTPDGNDISGTSMAAPGVAGLAGLLGEALQRQFGDDYEPPAALLKALIIAGADDLAPTGPDYKTGWGLANGRKSAELVALNAVSGGQYLLRISVPSNANLQNNSPVSFTIKALGGVPLVVTAVWLDLPGTEEPPPASLDPAGYLPSANQSLSVLKNDIDVKVARGGATWHPPSLNRADFISFSPNSTASPTYGLATYNGPNHRDTVEKIIIPQPGTTQSNPIAGQEYIITCKAADNVVLRNAASQPAPQDLYIVLSGIQPQGTPLFQIVWFEETADNEVTLMWPSVPGATYWVQYSDTLATGSWSDISGSSVTATQPYTTKAVAKPDQPHRFYRIRRAS